MIHPIKQANLKQGAEAENRLLSLFKKCFCRDLEKDPNPYATMDFCCDCCLVELKSRNVKRCTYETTMIGMNKVEYALRSKKTSYFVFEFTDGVYYWKFSCADFNSFVLDKGGTSKRGMKEESYYLYIPVNKLIKLELELTSPSVVY